MYEKNPKTTTPQSKKKKTPKNKREGVGKEKKVLSDLCPAAHYSFFCSFVQIHRGCQGAEIQNTRAYKEGPKKPVVKHLQSMT